MTQFWARATAPTSGAVACTLVSALRSARNAKEPKRIDALPRRSKVFENPFLAVRLIRIGLRGPCQRPLWLIETHASVVSFFGMTDVLPAVLGTRARGA